MKYKGCEISHIEYIKAVNNLDFDQGWSIVFEDRQNGRLIRSISCSIEPDVLQRQRKWLKRISGDRS
jgi:hypothetical protein